MQSIRSLLLTSGPQTKPCPTACTCTSGGGGANVGKRVDVAVGTEVGAVEGALVVVGIEVGRVDGAPVAVGREVGPVDGALVMVGVVEGSAVGKEVGLAVGADVGEDEGLAVGAAGHSCVGKAVVWNVVFGDETNWEHPVLGPHEQV
jgi:hypothetical protein